MQQKYRFDLPQTAAGAMQLQRQLARRIRPDANTADPSVVGALDVIYSNNRTRLYAAVCVVTFPELELIEQTRARGAIEPLNRPDLAWFAEAEIIRQTLRQLQCAPGILIVHGHGIAHPRRCGRACHIGVEFDVPTIGCSRRHRYGRHRPLGETKGATQPLMAGDRQVGVVYRSRSGVRPLYISPGHRCDLAFAHHLVIRCLRGFRMPEPLRLAHLYATKYRRQRD